MHSKWIPLATVAALSLASGCTASVAPAGGGAVTVTVSPPTAQLQVGGTATFTATVTGAANPAVTWSVQEGSAGGTVTSGGVYTAPGAAGTYHVVATSVADPTSSDRATVTVTTTPPPVTVTVSPSTAAIDACRTQTFRATVTGTANTAVTWSVREGAAGGTVTSGGTYTAPPDTGTYHVVATSVADPTRSGEGAASVTSRVLSVTVVPASASSAPSGSVPFSAQVTTTCGTFPAN